MQDSPTDSQGRFVQPPQLVWLAMNVLMTLIKPDAMVSMLQHEWPGFVDAVVQQCSTPGQHVWMVMGCLRMVLQSLSSQVVFLDSIPQPLNPVLASNPAPCLYIQLSLV